MRTKQLEIVDFVVSDDSVALPTTKSKHYPSQFCLKKSYHTDDEEAISLIKRRLNWDKLNNLKQGRKANPSE